MLQKYGDNKMILLGSEYIQIYSFKNGRLVRKDFHTIGNLACENKNDNKCIYLKIKLPIIKEDIYVKNAVLSLFQENWADNGDALLEFGLYHVKGKKFYRVPNRNVQKELIATQKMKQGYSFPKVGGTAYTFDITKVINNALENKEDVNLVFELIKQNNDTVNYISIFGDQSDYFAPQVSFLYERKPDFNKK